MHYLITLKNQLIQESKGYFNLKSVSTLQIHEITNHKLQKTKLLSVLHALLNVIFLN